MKHKKTIIKITAYLTVGLLFTLLTSNTEIDSLKAVIETADHDTTKAKALNKLALAIMYNNPDTAILIANDALQLYQNEQEIKGIANSYNTLGGCYWIKSDYPNALKYLKKALEYREKQNDLKGMAVSYNNIGIIYKNQSDYPLALAYYFKSLKIKEELSNKQGMAASYSNIGIIYDEQSDYPLALDYFFKSLKIEDELGNKHGMAGSYTNIGSLYTALYEKDTLDLTGFQNLSGLKKDALLDTAMYYQQKALAIDRELGGEYDMTFDLSGIADIYFKKGAYSHALTYYQEAALLADSIEALQRESEAHSGLSECYEKLGNHKLALEHYKQYSTLKDSVFNEEKSKDIGKLEAGYEYEIKMQEQRLEHEKKEAIAKEQAKKQRIIILSVSGGLVLMLVLAFFIYRGYRQKQKANLQLERKNATITRQMDEIEKQKAIVDEKNEDITASIRYAKRIQNAILTSDEYLTDALNQHFVLFKPKDVVSGDFYWAYQTKNKVIYIAADCTGHGVPGAFMSMIGNSILNEIVIEKEITEADKILNELNKAIIKTLGQTGATGEARDGMDIALCVWHKDTNKLEFAGANNPLYLIRKDVANLPTGQAGTKLCKNGNVKFFENDLAEIKGNKQPIGYEEGKEEPFTKHEIQLQKGDTIYIFSDGYQDQSGGPRNKKFMKKQFRQLFIDIQGKSMQEQKEILDKTIEDWKGDVEQIDDILVIGVRI